MPPNAIWALIFFNLVALAMWGFGLWIGTGERAVIFFGRDDYRTDIVRARAVSGFISLCLVLIAFNIKVFGGYELSDQKWVFIGSVSLGLIYYCWRWWVAAKREKERLARNLKPSDHD